MGNNSSRQTGTRGSSGSRTTSARQGNGAASGGRATNATSPAPAANAGAANQQSGAVPQHLANQYSNNNPRQRTSTTGPAGNNAAGANNSGPSGGNTATANNNQERGVQEGQMVKMLATIEATTVSYNSGTQLLTFYVTSACPSVTYEIHTGVKEFVQKGKVSYMPNKPKMEPTRTLIDGQQENRKVTVKLDVSKLDEKEKNYNKHYPKQMPCVIVIRYRTTELQKKDGSNDTEEMIVEHSEHTAVDLAEKPKRRVISQIVTACGNAYIVENLYGADSDNAGENGGVMVGSTIAPQEGDDDEDGLCVICLTNNKDTAVMPCRHMCMCKECGEQLLKHKPVCPVCRGPISTLLHMPSLSKNNNA